MKTIATFITGLFGVGILLCGCSKATGIDEVGLSEKTDKASGAKTARMAAAPAEVTFEQAETILKQNGYNTATMVEHEDYFLIDSELMFKKSFLAELIGKPAPRLSCSPVLDPAYHRLNLIAGTNDYLLIDDQTIVDAIKEWNNIERCGINFTANLLFNINNSRATTQLTIGEDPLGDFQFQNFINVNPPVNSIMPPDRQIVINTKKGPWSKLDSSQKKYLIMHALGHLIGFKHEDSNVSFPDPFSIMKPESGLATDQNLWRGFSSTDIYEIQKIYPRSEANYGYKCEPEITGTDKTLMVLGKEYTISTWYTYDWLLAPKYSFDFDCPEGVATYSVTRDNLIKLKFNKGGTCKIKVTATDLYNEKRPDGSDYSFDMKFHVVDLEPHFTFSSPDKMELDKLYDFKITQSNDTYTNPISYSFSVKETIFDGGTDKSVTTQRISDNYARLQFNDYGNYEITAEARYENKVQKYVVYFRKLYQQTYFETNKIMDGPHSDPPRPSSDRIHPTGPNRQEEYLWTIWIGFQQPIMPQRYFCYLGGYYRMITYGPNDKPTISLASISENFGQRILLKGASSQIDLPPMYSMFHPDSVNYNDHYSILYPLPSIIIPENILYVREVK